MNWSDRGEAVAPLLERAWASPLVTRVVGGLELLARGVHGGDDFHPPTQQVDHLAPPAGIDRFGTVTVAAELRRRTRSLLT